MGTGIEVLRDTPNGNLVEYDPTDDHEMVELAIGDDWTVDWETSAWHMATGRRRSPIRRSLSSLIENDESIEWNFGCDGHWEFGGTHRPSEVESALLEWLRDTDWPRDSTQWITGHANPIAPATGKSEPRHGIRTELVLQPEPPKCTGDEHDWRSPIDLVGGCRENPGVQGHGGGVLIHEVCRYCGTHKHTDTWAQRPDTGEQGATSISYREADDDSTAWVASLKEVP